MLYWSVSRIREILVAYLDVVVWQRRCTGSGAYLKRGKSAEHERAAASTTAPTSCCSIKRLSVSRKHFQNRDKLFRTTVIRLVLVYGTGRGLSVEKPNWAFQQAFIGRPDSPIR